MGPFVGMGVVGKLPADITLNGEICHFGKVDGEIRNACFPFSLNSETKLDFCPGGGRPILNAGGFVETCDLEVPCLGRSICNPVYGICCSKLRTCPFPQQPVLESDSHRPVICQLRGSRQLECPADSDCERLTGFCCTQREKRKIQKLRVGEICEEGDHCLDNSFCECVDDICECRCSHSMGYSLDEETATCRRTRRRLKEKCKFDVECQSAFSECSSGGCRCRKGFRRKENGGCEPINHKCVNHAQPLQINEEIFKCVAKKGDQEIEKLEILNDFPNRNKRETKEAECPHKYYCVPIFDVPHQPHLYQGFCCPLPEPEVPVCPVGDPHPSSQPPNYGCADCPWDHFCHNDAISTKQKICCAKPCLSPEDVYADGQCYPVAQYGDSCLVTEQCVTPNAAQMDESKHSEMECIRGICSCIDGFYFLDGLCKRILCSVGISSEPSVDSEGNIEKCKNSSDCSLGYICDPAGVCCKGAKRCPKNYSETGRLCDDEGFCDTPEEVCVRSKSGTKNICCKPESSFIK